jgi:two-component system, chemotaxis family, response regulator Rcp1
MMDETVGDSFFNILIVEDNPGDVRLMQEALREGSVPCRLHVAPDGVEAIAFLRRQGAYSEASRPDFILLDLNVPRKHGSEVLADIKSDPALRQIPVIVLTTSAAWHDVQKAYDLHANCYITKPVDLALFIRQIRLIKEFWCTMVQLPREENHGQ